MKKLPGCARDAGTATVATDGAVNPSSWGLTFFAIAGQRGMKLAVLALVTTLGLGSVVQADPAPGAARPRGELRQLLLERFDRNHDGRLDPQERRRAILALHRLARRMAMQERRAQYRNERREERAEGRREEQREERAESRNELREERAARRAARNRALIERFDRNGDGVVTPDEMPPGMARRLRRLDRNGDGSLDDRDQR
jgi:hypothetical protein